MLSNRPFGGVIRAETRHAMVGGEMRKTASYRKSRSFGCEYKRERAHSGLPIEQTEYVLKTKLVAE